MQAVRVNSFAASASVNLMSGKVRKRGDSRLSAVSTSAAKVSQVHVKTHGEKGVEAALETSGGSLTEFQVSAGRSVCSALLSRWVFVASL